MYGTLDSDKLQVRLRMPKPGPRPYECVRRAWHSDDHQPLRGRLTQEILRIASELHKPETKRKNQWQEKLPTVVFRAEEILYSKAKSEADYTDTDTLRARLEDAIDTMIRRTDTGKEDPYMEPCVEAALSLGCCPKSFPRGQKAGSRHAAGIAKPLSYSFPGTPPASTTPSINRHHSGFQLPELTIPGSMHSSLDLQPNHRPDTRLSFLHSHSHHPRTGSVYTGFVLSNHEADRQESPSPATQTEGTPGLLTPNTVGSSPRYPLLRLVSCPASDQTSRPWNDSWNSVFHHGSQHLQPPPGGLKPFTEGPRRGPSVLAHMTRPTEAPASLLLDDYSTSAVLNPYSCPVSRSVVSRKAEMRTSALSRVSASGLCDSAESALKEICDETKGPLKMKRVDAPAEQSTGASPVAEFDELQLRLAPPQNSLPPLGISQGMGMASGMSCVTHAPAQPVEAVGRLIGGSSNISRNLTKPSSLARVSKTIMCSALSVARVSKTIMFSAVSETATDPHLPNVVLDRQSVSSHSDNTHLDSQEKNTAVETPPVLKRPRLITDTLSLSADADASRCSGQSSDQR